MCTASWLIRPSGYELFFNRDERNERLPAEAPRLSTVGSRTVIAPRDGDAGGSWIGVNDHGLTLGLLNGWQDPESVVSEPRSRGLLLLDLLESADAEELESRIEALDLSIYRGFHLLALTLTSPSRTGEAVSGFRWNGTELRFQRPEGPLSSSSYRGPRGEGAEEIAFERRSQLEELRERHGGLDAYLLEHLHTSHYPKRGAFSVCMHREDASTQSSTHIAVEGDRARVRYAPGPPCETPFGEALELPLNVSERALR